MAVVAVAALMLAALLWHVGTSRSAQTSLLDRAAMALDRGDAASAESLVTQFLRATNQKPESVEQLFAVGRQLLSSGRLATAEACLRRVLRHDPSHTGANDHLVFLLRIEGRLWDAQQPLLALFQSGCFIPEQTGRAFPINAAEYLVAASTTEFLLLTDDETRFAEMCHNSVADDFLPYLGQARQDLWADDLGTAESVFRQVADKHPEIPEAQVGVGTVLLRSQRPEAFLAWRDRLPRSAYQHPDIWVLLGMFAKEFGHDAETTARCFREAVRLHPGHRQAAYHLAQSLRTLGRTEDAEVLSRHAAKLASLEYAIRTAVSEPRRIREVVELLDSMGRFYEATGWCELAREMRTDVDWATERLTGLRSRTAEARALVASEFRPVVNPDLPPISAAEVRVSDSSDAPARRTEDVTIRFQDDSASAGLEFQFFNGSEPDDNRAWMFEFCGGGVASFDFDADDWPDLYFTQGCLWPPSRLKERAIADRMFRNMSGNRMTDVTAPSGLGDLRYTCGVTSGDIDADGFDDPYLSNIGGNSLYRNNGDGTFSRVPDSCGASGEDWTVSSVMADLNGDRLPDIYAVNYLAGDVLERTCTHRGRPIQCYPTSFPAAQDRLYLNQGDGTFADVTDASGIVMPDGKGMGVVAADLDNWGDSACSWPTTRPPISCSRIAPNCPQARRCLRNAEFPQASRLVRTGRRSREWASPPETSTTTVDPTSS
ncbi:MAG: FG-GAP-like repeat-containing protein [Planctomycetaceae bacterium]